MNPKRLTSDLRWTIVSLLLVAIGWPGPRPIVHCHATLVTSFGLVTLARHLEKSHLLADCAVDPQKPHIHWAFSFSTDEVLETSTGSDSMLSSRNGEPTPVVAMDSSKKFLDVVPYQQHSAAICNLQSSCTFNPASQKLRLRLAVSANVLFCSMTC